MKYNAILSSAFLAGLMLSSSALAASVENTPAVKHNNPLTISLVNAKNQVVGTAILSEVLRGVKIEITASKLSPGKHGIHLHETGKCEGPDFKSAGSHFNPSGQAHGFDQASGPHAGDLPNLVADAKGNAHAEMFDPNVTLDQGTASLLKGGGTALVIHAKADDDHSQPAGESGDRIACGVIKRP
jgi:Cu-Zn family superoxide dismutase